MSHQRFSFPDIEHLRNRLAEIGDFLPLSENHKPLAQPITFSGYQAPNRIAIQPMEGCDGTGDGAPDELTVRRYHRFARSGAGLIWAEATAVVPEGRANPRQLMITEDNLDKFKSLVDDIRKISAAETGIEPVLILQLTHSGRYSKPEGRPEPLVARNNPIFEKTSPLDAKCIVSDDYLSHLPEQYARSARLAERAGFDGVDVKACHGYLLNELLSSYTRPGMYGGDFDGRTRLFREAVIAVRQSVKGIVTSRMSLYDGFPHPYGWGIDSEGSPDLKEPAQLIKWFVDNADASLIDVTVGNPYVNPHVNRPYDSGPYVPQEHPLTGAARMRMCTSEIKRQFPRLTVIGSGYSYLRQYSQDYAAGMVSEGDCDMAGFGRMAFAYPEFAREIISGKGLDEKKCCIACGKCSELMRAGTVSGCVIRDGEIYLPIYNREVKGRVN